MNNKQIIEKLVNISFRELILNRVINGFEGFESLVLSEFPDLKFTYDVQSKTIILLTEV